MIEPGTLEAEFRNAYFQGVIRLFTKRLDRWIVELEYETSTEKKIKLKEYLESKYKIEPHKLTIRYLTVEIRL